MYAFILLAAAWVSPAPNPPHSLTVVDATTSRPLVGVQVRGAGSAVVESDAQGRVAFEPAAGNQSLTLNRLGYAPLVLTWEQFQQADTLRLLPQAYVLDEVAVRARAPQTRTLTSVPDQGAVVGMLLMPGQSDATSLFRPAGLPAGTSCVLNKISLFMVRKPRPGQLRVRLLALSAQTGPVATADLLPVPLYVTGTQLRGKRIELDLRAYNLLLPPQGLYLVVECVPTATDPVVARPEGSPQGADYPCLEARFYKLAEVPERLTWFRKSADAAWYQPSSRLNCLRWEVQLAVY